MYQILNQTAMMTLEQARNPLLIFLDPPFNIGEPYEHGDKRGDYYEWVRKVISMAAFSLDENGSLWINCPDQHAAKFYQFADSECMKLENWCIWHYRFAQCQPHRFLRSKTHVLWFSFGNPQVFPETARVPSDRATIYDDPRVEDYEKGGTRMDFDVWGFDPYWGRVQGNNRERQSLAPNQIPEKYMERVIRLCTKEGDLVVDPFVGSGTTAVVADALGRDFIGGDLSRTACENAKKRKAVRV